jgi:hypothetical protein
MDVSAVHGEVRMRQRVPWYVKSISIPVFALKRISMCTCPSVFLLNTRSICDPRKVGTPWLTPRPLYRGPDCARTLRSCTTPSPSTTACNNKPHMCYTSLLWPYRPVTLICCQLWNLHSTGYDTVHFCGWILKFRRNIQPQFSGLKFLGSGKVLVTLASYKERDKVANEEGVNKGSLSEPMGIYGKNMAFFVSYCFSLPTEYGYVFRMVLRANCVYLSSTNRIGVVLELRFLFA